MIAAILLAAGESTRMGQPKQLLDWHRQPLVVAQTETLLKAGCRPVIVVLGAHAAPIRPLLPAQPDVQVTTNHHWRAGRASSVRTGARAVPPTVDGIVVVSVDQPTNPAIIDQLQSALDLAPDARIGVPRHNGRNGHPPIFHRNLLPELQQVTERQQGLRSIRRRHAERTIFVEMYDPIVTLNLNTPEAYQRAVDLPDLPDLL